MERRYELGKGQRNLKIGEVNKGRNAAAPLVRLCGGAGLFLGARNWDLEDAAAWGVSGEKEEEKFFGGRQGLISTLANLDSHRRGLGQATIVVRFVIWAEPCSWHLYSSSAKDFTVQG